MALNPPDPVLYNDNEIDYGSKKDGRQIAKDTEYAGGKETLHTLKLKIRVNAMKGQGNTATVVASLRPKALASPTSVPSPHISPGLLF